MTDTSQSSFRGGAHGRRNRLAPRRGPPLDVDAKTLTIQVGASLREVEKQVIKATLCHCDGNRTLAAKILGIDRSTVYMKIKEYKLER